MAIRNIKHVGEECLEKVCATVTEFDSTLHTLIDDMWDTLLETTGVGLSAPQVGETVRVFIAIDIDNDNKHLEFVNPVILEQSGTQKDAEGCLSLPGKFGIVERPQFLTMRAQDRYGNTFTIDAEGLLARILSHEDDHLIGEMFTQYVDRFLTDEELEQLREERKRKKESKDKQDNV